MGDLNGVDKKQMDLDTSTMTMKGGGALLHRQQQPIEHKDFVTEVRGIMDIMVALINAVLSIFGLPFMHAVLPHSPLHVQCLADKETRVTNGYARDVVTYVRETRLTNIFSNILIGITMLFLQYILPYIPKAVLDGLFLYMAVTALYGNQMFERVTLLVTEQSAYPPNHYIKRVPQRKMHTFTACQLINLLVLCVFGFTPWPYIKMIFPVVLACFLPIRHKVLPLLIEKKYLEAIDPTTKD